MTLLNRDSEPGVFMPQRSDNHGIQVHVRHVVIALEHMISLTGFTDVHHGKRVAYIATKIGAALGYRGEALEILFNAGMVHDCGVSTQRLHGALTRTFIPLNVNTTEHCNVGHDLLADFSPLAYCAQAIKYHHTPWRSLKAANISSAHAEMANIIFFADRLDTLAQQRDVIDTHAIVEITEKLNTATNVLFSPKINEAYISLAPSKSFWNGMESASVVTFVNAHEFSLQDQIIVGEDIRKMARIFGRIADQKSRFTQHHSHSVGLIARFLAQRCNLPLPICEKIEMAGLLHNVGKMHVPDHILDKAGPLSLQERAILHEHPNHTYDILNHIKGIEDVTLWASSTHKTTVETGSGVQYQPYNMEANIVKMANAFRALIEDRPYRWGQSLSDTLATLIEMTRQAKFDPMILEVICAYPEDCLHLATT
jgi:HD-GYP domain-containing protein (c-di-GMP phosphodiesterase class II)